MTLVIDGHSFHYEMENLCRVFFPDQKIHVASEPDEDSPLVYTGIREETDGIRLSVRLKTENGETEKSEMITPQEAEHREPELRMGILLFELLCQEFSYRPKWGILTGVRPIKLFGRLATEMGEEQAARYFREKLLVSEEKTKLSRLVSGYEQKILSVSRPESCSIYVAIPFCPTRCSYCSFVSSSVEKAFRLIPEYVELLCEEIRQTAQIVLELGLRIETVYFGGGTPTAISADQLGKLLDTVRNSCNLSHCREFTVEAGRPDTVTREKLAVLKAHEVSRISINPQTLSDEVLRNIGRRHTTAQTLEAFELARRHGFNNINMDLIAGLPGDSEESFRMTVDGVLKLDPESITIHSLALKRAANLFQTSGAQPCSAKDAEAMLDYADGTLLSGGYVPYYLYRQSRMAGNLENTGWAKPGFEGYYNVFIMEECQTILACGAGAVTKLRDPHSSRIERIFNFKYPYEYNSRFSEMMKRKERVREFYGS
jgi:oxygen-independent coproporphyrinogen III oxidase